MNLYPGLVVVVGIVVLVVRVERGAGDQAGQGEQQQQHGYLVGRLVTLTQMDKVKI